MHSDVDTTSQGFVYLHVFPIADQERPLSALRAEACMDLDALAAEEANAKITGDPVWAVAGDRLVCWAPARPLDDDEPRAALPGVRTPSQTIAQIRRLSHLGVNEIAYRLGVARATVRLYREAAS